MNTVVIHGKVIDPISPKVQFPRAHLWGCTHTQQQYTKRKKSLDDWDEWFDLHPVERTPFYEGIKIRRPATWQWYKTLPPGRPVWMLERHRDVPASQRFPHEEVRAAFPIEDEPGSMITCQVDWMMAWALLRGYEHIVLHGHGVNSKPQHMADHRGIMYWVGFLRGRGLKVTVLPPSWYRAPELAYGTEAGGGWRP